MPIPNISSLYQRIHPGAEGGHEYARFIKLLLHSHYENLGKTFIAESDASGDFQGLDAYVFGPNEFPELITGFHFKFYPANLKSGQKREVEQAIVSAIASNWAMRKLILITPEDFTKEGQSWWESLQKKHDRNLRAKKGGILIQGRFQLIHWGHTKIIELALTEGAIGRRYFPELFPQGAGTISLAHAGIDCNNSDWHPLRTEKNAYGQIYHQKNNGRITDPLFDFQFTNNMGEICLLHSIDIVIEKIASALRGIPPAHFLKSIGTIEHEIDFAKKCNTITLFDPMIFPAQEARRFNVQLTRFTDNARGNCVDLKFLFNFDKCVVLSQVFSLNF